MGCDSPGGVHRTGMELRLSPSSVCPSPVGTLSVSSPEGSSSCGCLRVDASSRVMGMGTHCPRALSQTGCALCAARGVWDPWGRWWKGLTVPAGKGQMRIPALRVPLPWGLSELVPPSNNNHLWCSSAGCGQIHGSLVSFNR